MDEHVYTSANSTFLLWHEWVDEFGTIEDKLAHMSEEFSIEKMDLYDRWLEDQKITSYEHIVNDEIIQKHTWIWE